MRLDPVWLSLAAGRVVREAQVPYQVASKLLKAGMDEEQAIEWARTWKRTEKTVDELLKVWKRKQPKRRRLADG